MPVYEGTPTVTAFRRPRADEQPLSSSERGWIGPYWTIAAWVWVALLFWALLFGLFWFQ